MLTTDDKKEIKKIVKQELKPIEADVRTVRTDIRTLKTDSGKTKMDVKEMKIDIRILKDDVDSLKVDLNSLGEKIDVVSGSVIQIEQDREILKDIWNFIQGHTVQLKNHEARITSLESSNN